MTFNTLRRIFCNLFFSLVVFRWVAQNQCLLRFRKKRRRRLHLLWWPELLSGTRHIYCLLTVSQWMSVFKLQFWSVGVVVCLQDECSEDGTLAEDTLNSDASKLNLCKQWVMHFCLFTCRWQHCSAGTNRAVQWQCWWASLTCVIFPASGLVSSSWTPCEVRPGRLWWKPSESESLLHWQAHTLHLHIYWWFLLENIEIFMFKLRVIIPSQIVWFE